jgi:2-dehydro-3-deoxy-D-gluconate 5-dehydrogenase
VTGGGRGLGRAISLALAEYGARVVLVGRQTSALEETSKEIEDRGGIARYVKCDVTQLAALSDLIGFCVEAFGSLDILVNNAGVTIVKPSLELSEEEWRQVLDTNLTATFFCANAAAKQFLRQETGGVIINIASVGALQGGSGVYSSYSASKGGVVSLTRSLASEWAKHNIRVNCIAPGAFNTDMSRAAYDDPAIHAAYVRRIPRGRTAEAFEIAPLAVYLASRAADFVTGETFVIDGGQVMK